MYSLLFSVFSVVSGAQSRVVVVVCERLTWADVNANCPFLVSLQDRCALGLMNTTVAGAKNPTSATLALAVGQQQAAEAGDEDAVGRTETVPDEGATGDVVYQRRTGTPVPPGCTIVHLNIASLTRRRINTESLGTVLVQAHPPRRVLICGNADTNMRQRRGALFAIDAAGTATGDVALSLHSERESARPFGLADDTDTLARYAVSTDADVFIAVLGDLARVEALRTRLTLDAYRSARRDALRRLDTFFLQLFVIRPLDTANVDVLLISPCPPSVYAGARAVGAKQGERETGDRGTVGKETWERLTPVLAIGPHFPPGLLTSPTTRTRGLVANIDFAPTLLHSLDVPIPSTMVGRPMQTFAEPGDIGMRQQVIARLDFLTTLNAQALTRVLMPISALCFGLVLASICAYRCGGARAARWFRPCLIFTLALPLGLLLATVQVPPTLWEYGLRALAWMAILTLLSYVLARLLRVSPPVACGLIGIVLIVADLFRGQQLLKDSVWSAYALSGIRYYGIGNEYLGVTLGYALLGGFTWLSDLDLLPHPPTESPLLSPEPPTLQVPAENEAPSIARVPLTEKVQNGDINNGSEFADNTDVTNQVDNADVIHQDNRGVMYHAPTERSFARIMLLAGWFSLAMVLGWPSLGANAGSLIITGAGFGVGAWMLAGRRFAFSVAGACLLLGIGFSFAFGLLDARLFGAQSSHAGNVLNAVGQGQGPGYLAEIMARKVGMNLRLLVSPFFLLGASLVALILLFMRAVLGETVRALFAANYWLRQSLPPLAVTLVAALLFKDSGVVTAAILAGTACLYILWQALEGNSH